MRALETNNFRGTGGGGRGNADGVQVSSTLAIDQKKNTTKNNTPYGSTGNHIKAGVALWAPVHEVMLHDLHRSGHGTRTPEKVRPSTPQCP